jgi:glutamate-1-semialdehyde aminotransferase
MTTRTDAPPAGMTGQQQNRDDRALPTSAALASAGSGWALYERAKALIPGGTQLLSKRPELFLPGGWPCYYARAKGCAVWDLDGRRLIDMTTTGIGACLLGYADDAVNDAVKQCVDRGNLCTLNVPAEVELAQTLCGIHPWAAMARFARTGGEAMAVAVRIARAFTGRSRVAVCGYHGWADWYIAANLAQDRALDGHLLPGLAPSGVPRELAGTASTFRYNDVAELERAVSDGSPPAAIVMEPMRFTEPADRFLHRVRDAAVRAGAVLIFDEITSGWRHTFGGVHLRYGVHPEIAVFAKSLANGFPMAAVIGTTDVMQAAQDSFISSTYWTDALGPTAALATLRRMRELAASDLATAAGRQAQQGWAELAHRHGLKITISGLPACCRFALDYGDQSGALRTLLTQEMLDRGFLATGLFYPTVAHTSEIVSSYLAALDETFAVLRRAVDAGDAAARLRGPVAHSGFARLT